LQELPSSVRHGGRPNKEEALLAVAVLGRIRRAISQVRAAGVQLVGVGTNMRLKVFSGNWRRWVLPAPQTELNIALEHP